MDVSFEKKAVGRSQIPYLDLLEVPLETSPNNLPPIGFQSISDGGIDRTLSAIEKRMSSLLMKSAMEALDSKADMCGLATAVEAALSKTSELMDTEE